MRTVLAELRIQPVGPAPEATKRASVAMMSVASRGVRGEAPRDVLTVLDADRLLVLVRAIAADVVELPQAVQSARGAVRLIVGPLNMP